MSIVAVDPQKWQDANVVQVDSDATDNSQAIDEIEHWAAENGFARVNEGRLRPILRANQSVFRGVCYRLTDEEYSSSAAVCQSNAEAMANMPTTEHCPDSDD